jgi:molybdopterin-containing oxidoreductase family iron-sulfur binding subunit
MAELNRRDFFKMVGVTGATGALVACDPRTPVENIYPYVIQEEQITPGIPTLFASTCTACSASCGTVLRNREGRVVFVGGNADAPANAGVCALGIASTQDVYDPDRLQGPMDAGAETTWDAAITKIGGALAGGSVAWLGRYNTGSLDRLVGEFTAATGARRLHWEVFGYESLATATELAFGVRGVPSYRVAEAQVIVSFGADWLQTWLNPVGHTAGFSAGRDPGNGWVSEFWTIEPRVSHTGTKCDTWLKSNPGTEAGVALALAKLVADKNGANGAESYLAGVDPAAMASAAGIELSKLQSLADKLASHSSVVFPGGVTTQSANSTHLALATLVLNWVCGNIGTTVSVAQGTNLGSVVSSFAEVKQLLEDCAAGKVKTLFIDQLDLDFVLPAELGVTDALAKVENLVVFTNGHGHTRFPNATLLPPGSWLETWGDAAPTGGSYLIQQPGMLPQVDAKGVGDVLLALAKAANLSVPAPEVSEEAPIATQADGEEATVVIPVTLGEHEATASFAAHDFYRYVAGVWHEGVFTGLDFQTWWVNVLQTGGATVESDWAEPGLRADLPAPVGGDALAGDLLLLYPHTHLRDGRGANKPWLSETPHPVSGLAWATWAEMSRATADKLGVGVMRGIDTLGWVTVKTDSASTSALNVRVSKGMPDGHIAVVAGNGHEQGNRYELIAGRSNALRMISASADPVSGALVFLGHSVSAASAPEGERRNTLKGSESMDNRPIALSTNAQQVLDGDDLHLGHGMGIHIVHDPRLAKAGITDMYPEPEHPTYRWGLAIDLDKCTGCGACEVACHSENNVPMTGPEQHERYRYMGWIRLDRFWEGEGEHPDVRFSMAICQQCAHAPCEGVCPVVATYHNLDGLNAMIYNRCVGTRYCANNCPYSARRFNWHSYRWPESYNMMLNPDVSTREMGVMEKCTFCIQRIRFAKSMARPATLLSNQVERLTACAEACPSQAIVFGNAKEEGSKLLEQWTDPRAYELLKELNTKNGVRYLAKMDHQDPHHGGGHGDEGHGAGHDDGGHDAPSDGHGDDHGGGHADDEHTEGAAGADHH